MNRILSLSLTMALLWMSIGSIVSGQQQLTSSTAIARIKKAIVKRCNVGTVTLTLRNGSKLKGRITQTAENMFTLKEANSRFSHDLHYADVLKVNTGSLTRGAKFGILTSIFTGTVLLGALISLRHSDP